MRYKLPKLKPIPNDTQSAALLFHPPYFRKRLRLTYYHPFPSIPYTSLTFPSFTLPFLPFPYLTFPTIPFPTLPCQSFSFQVSNRAYLVG